MLASTSLRECAWTIATACAVLVFSCRFDAQAAPVISQAPSVAAEPFALNTRAVTEGSLSDKWRAVERAIVDDLKVIAQCRDDHSSCSSPEALQFLKIVADASEQSGLARVGTINRAFNLAIRPVSDLAQYGVEDVWTSPLATLASGAGDCEDYAIAKYVALREAGISQEDLRLVILRNETSGEDHAVAAVRVEGRWRMLDNRFLLMLEDTEVTKFQPLFAIDAEGAKRFEQQTIVVADAKTAQPSIEADISAITFAVDPASIAPVDDLWQLHPM
ncbi:MAG: transglutaminase-like cysteine peptidase [Afipia sp.]|nr:transglutaminase-like cysteine peptidase [Afipia sp.]